MDRREGRQGPSEWALGQHFMARIEALLPDHRFRVVVNGRGMLLQLPGSTLLGETLELVVLAKTDRDVIAGPIVYTPLKTALSTMRRWAASRVSNLSSVVGTCRREVNKWILKA